MLAPQSLAVKRSNRGKQRTLQELDEAWFHKTYTVESTLLTIFFEYRLKPPERTLKIKNLKIKSSNVKLRCLLVKLKNLTLDVML